LAYVVIRRVWQVPFSRAIVMAGPFLLIETIFLIATLHKLQTGGVVPVGIACFVAVMMATWARGTRHLYEQTHHATIPLATLQANLAEKPPTEIDGTAIFMTSDPLNAPLALIQNIRHNHVLHRHNVILTIVVTHTPRVDDEKRLMIEHVSDRFTRVLMVFGYAETPDVPRAIMLGAAQDPALANLQDATYFLGRRSITTSPARALQAMLAREWQGSTVAKNKRPWPMRIVVSSLFTRTAAGLPLWQSQLFIALTGAAATATDFYRIPRSQVVELGIQLSI
jgi:KUP system potassium uptake protein